MLIALPVVVRAECLNSRLIALPIERFCPLVADNASHLVFFFFSSRRRHTSCSRDWSSDVCSSDLGGGATTNLKLIQLPKMEVTEVTDFGKKKKKSRSEERRVGKECRSRWSQYH